MSGDPESEKTPQEQKILPNISEHSRFVEAASRRLFIGKGWKDTLDTVYIWWNGVNTGREKGEYRDLEEAAVLPGIPDLERNYSQRLLGERKNEFDRINKKITKTVTSPKPRWGQVKSIESDIDSYHSDEPLLEQTVSALQVIEKHQSMEPEKMRRLVAQQAWAELWDTIRERIKNYQETDYGENLESFTTQDIRFVEKLELEGALNSDVWSEDTIEKQSEMYDEWWEEIDDEYSDYINDDLTTVWEAVLGENTKQVSALEVLAAAERVYQGLEEEEALDYED